MTPGSTEILDTLQEDGTLVLDHKPGLPAGRVRVVIQSVAPSATPAEALRVLQEIWAERKEMGLQSRSAEEIDAALNAARDEWEEDPTARERIQQEARRARGQP
jgi:hypothetical protein